MFFFQRGRQTLDECPSHCIVNYVLLVYSLRVCACVYIIVNSLSPRACCCYIIIQQRPTACKIGNPTRGRCDAGSPIDFRPPIFSMAQRKIKKIKNNFVFVCTVFFFCPLLIISDFYFRVLIKISAVKYIYLFFFFISFYLTKFDIQRQQTFDKNFINFYFSRRLGNGVLRRLKSAHTERVHPSPLWSWLVCTRISIRVFTREIMNRGTPAVNYYLYE